MDKKRIRENFCREVRREVLADREEKKDVYIIPPNFIDTGTLFGGMMKVRNVIEAFFLLLSLQHQC